MTSLIVLSFVVLFALGLSLYLEKKTSLNPVISRKILHIVAISCCAVSIFYVSSSTLILIVGIVLPILILAVLAGFFKDPQSGRRSWGIVYFAFSFALLLLLFPDRKELIYYPMMIMALADGLAAVAGIAFSKAPTSETKTLAGSLTFFIISLLVLIVSSYSISEFSSFSIPFLVTISIVLTAIEFISKYGTDNITVPLAFVYWVQIDQLNHEFTLIILTLLTIFSSLAIRFKWLSKEGAILALIFGMVYLVSPFPVGIVPAITFFVFGSLLSRLPGNADAIGRQRTAMQVFSNGGPSVLAFGLFCLIQDRVFLLMSIVGFAAAISDTTSSELGTRYGKVAYDILGLRKLEIGASGGISLIGTLGGLFAAAALSLITSLFITLSYREIAFISILGFFGNILDSLLGSILQAKYQSSTGLWSDVQQSSDINSAGVSWFSNNLTNLLSIAIIITISFFMFRH